MILTVDAATIRLDLEMFDALTSDPHHPEHQQAAQVPGFAEGLEAVPHARVEVDIAVAGAHGTLRHHVWIGDDAALFLSALHIGADTLYQAIATPVQHVPAGLAKLVGLGPRDVPAVSRLITLDDVEQILDGPRPGPALDRAGLTRAWRIAAVPITRDGQIRDDAQRTLATIRHHDHQWVLAGMNGPDNVVAEPASTIDLWAAISSITNP